MNAELAKHIAIPEASLAFHPERVSDTDIHPLRGLLRFGPYSSGTLPDPIRVATIAPSGDQKNLFDFLKSLRANLKPGERRDYLEEWPGFQRVFGVHIAAADHQCHMQLDKSTDEAIRESASPHVILSEHLVRAIGALDTYRNHFDVLFIYLPQRWSAGFEGPAGDDFDLHDYLKALSASKGIPVQVIREDRAPAYRDRASVMWRIGIALYAKAGGVPWKLSQTEPGTAYIGLSYALRSSGQADDRFVTCCSQVFDSGGAGLEFIAYDVDEVRIDRKNPFLSQTEMFRVMTRSLDLYRRRHAGQSPRSIVVHKTTEFKPEEADGCLEAFHLCDSVDLIQIVQHVGWRGVAISQDGAGRKGKASAFPIARGSLLTISPKEALLWTHGNVEGVSTKGSYFQGARSTPQPLRLIRHAGHGPWEPTATSILGLTKMDWNNDALYDPLPVTISYAGVLARIVKRMTDHRRTAYQVRFFM